MGIGIRLVAATIAILATLMSWPRGTEPTPPTAYVATTGGPAPGADSRAERPTAQRTAAAAGTGVLAGGACDP